MALLIAFTVLSGIAAGRLFLGPEANAPIEAAVTYLLALLVFAAGIEIGRNKTAFGQLKKFGWKIGAVPLAIVVGTLAGAALAAGILNLPLHEVLAVGAGLGWYSLSGILIAQLYSIELGTTAFLANVFRELLAFLMIPFLARHLGKITAIAPGGATTMDSTLPLITKVTDTHTALIAFISGLVLTTLIPFLIPFLLSC